MKQLLKVGKKAPRFGLPDKDSNIIALNDFTNKYKVVYFYPKDNTPGCTIQAKQFSKDLKKIAALNAVVVGISGGDAKTKTTFCSKNKLTIALLSDSNFKVAEKYGVYGKKTFMGRTYLGISRVTYLLDENNTIVKVYEKASPEKNSQEILADLRIIQAGTNKPSTAAPKVKVKRLSVKRKTAASNSR